MISQIYLSTQSQNTVGDHLSPSLSRHTSERCSLLQQRLIVPATSNIELVLRAMQIFHGFTQWVLENEWRSTGEQ